MITVDVLFLFLPTPSLLSPSTDAGWYLLLITDARSIGRLPNTKSDVFCIERVVLVPLSVEKSIDEIKMEVSK